MRFDPGEAWLGANVEVLPLTMVNLLQRVNLETLMRESTTIWQSTSIGDNHDWVADQERAIVTKDDIASSLDSDTGTDGSEHGDAVSSPVKQVDYEDEFGEDELGKLVKSEGSCRDPATNFVGIGG
jgi:hypothetical protein